MFFGRAHPKESMSTASLIQTAVMLVVIAAACNNEQKHGDMEAQTADTVAKTTTAISKDGTAIAYDKIGNGPTIIIVNGALAQRDLYPEKSPARLLADKFTVISYDRRGRGESTDTKPYSVEREIEDIAALIDEAGGNAFLFGGSSGAALALLAAEKLGPEKVIKLALYEPPYGSDTREKYAGEKQKVNELVADGKPGDAVAFFMERRGMPPDKMEAFKTSPQWKGIVGIGHTLVYDFEVLGDGTIPVDVAKNIAVPTLVMVGEKSFDFMQATADELVKSIPGATRKTIKGQTHDLSPDAVAPVLGNFLAYNSDSHLKQVHIG
jgi:pimeloyl-ACP methyl ester carboxylesterase